MKTRMRVFAPGLAVVFFLFFTIFQTTAPYETSVSARQQRTSTTVADNKYGEGGTLTTTSDEKLKLHEELWKDKDGKTREVHRLIYEKGYEGDKSKDVTAEVWGFFYKGPLATFILVQVEDGIVPPHWKFGRAGVPGYDIEKQDAYKLIEEIEKQFAKDGTIPKIAKETAKPEEKPKQETGVDTQVEQPKLPKDDPCLEAFSSTANSPKKVSVDLARTLIKCYIARIEVRKKYMADAYYDVGAKKTLETSFKAKGVTASMRYADSWGEMGIGLTWSESAKGFYDHHQDVLNQLLDIIQERGYATGSEMASLNKGMSGFDNYDRNLEFQFKKYVESYTEEAKVNDEKEAVSKKYGIDLGQVSAVRPYNASAVAALNVQYAQAVKPLDAKVRLIEGDQSVIKTSVANLAGQNMFPVFKKAP